MPSKPLIRLKPKTQTLSEASFTDHWNSMSSFGDASFYKVKKKQISIRLDADVLAWFQAQPEKYQTLINKALRTYMRFKQMNVNIPPDEHAR